MKRILSLTLALVMVLGTFTAVFAAEPTVEEVAGAFLEKVGVLVGDDEGDLLLEENLERRDAVILLSRLLDQEEVAKEFPTSEESPSWTDARTDAYYVPFFAWAEANKYFEGNDDGTFAPREAITAQEYALVLLRALGYEASGHDAWKAALETAKELGLLVDVEVKDADKVLRGQMAVMTLNALGTKINDSDKTLAEELGIELPVPAVLEVEEVRADNLKEIKVLFNKAADAEAVLNLDNYETDAGDIKDITYLEDENMAVLLLDGTMKDKKEYEITIEGIEEINITKEFTAVDNAIPEVVEVIGLGTKAVKVVMSEPVKDAKTTNFKLDGKNVYGAPQTAGREIVLKVYSDLTVGEHEITVRNLEDYAGFKSLETIHGFEVEEDKDAPTVANVDAWLERVVVTFSEDVDNDTVNRYSVYWKSGSTKKYPESAERLAGNKYEFVFSQTNALPAHETTLYVEGVKDYSGNKMAAAEVAVKASIDTTRPEVKEVEVKSDKVTIEIKFTKSLALDTVKDIKNYTVLDKDDNKLIISEANLKKDDSKTVLLVLGKALKENEDYTLKISGLKDNNKYANTMIDYSEVISVGNFTGPELKVVTMDYDYDKSDKVYRAVLHLFFSKDMDLATLSNPENYLVEIDGSNKLLSKLDGEIDIIKNDGAVVVLTIEDEDAFNITGVAGLGLKDIAGKELKNYGKIVEVDKELEFTVKEEGAVAVAKDKIEIEFTMLVDKAPRDAFGGVKVKEVEIDGDTVTLKLEEKISAAASEKVTIDGEKVISFNGEKLVGVPLLGLTLKDEIKPSIKEVELKEQIITTDGAIEIIVTFDEDVTTGEGIVFEAEKWKTDLVVKKVVGDEKVEYELFTAEKANQLKIQINNIDIVEDTAIEVAVKDARFIKDASNNKAANSSDRTVKIKGLNTIATAKVEKAEAEGANQNDVDEAQAWINELPDGDVKKDLQDRLDAIEIN